jgi:outer membrane protein TolC
VNEDLIKVKKSDYLPTVSLFGTYQFQAQADKLGDLDFQPVAYVGLNLSMNLFNGRKTDAQVSEAEVSYEQSKLQLDQLQHGLETQVEAVLRRIGYARERINATDRTIEQAERGYQIATTSYKAGTGTQLQINDADLALAQSKWNQLTAVHDYYVGLAELEQLLGQRYQVTPDGEDVRYSLK